MSSGPHILFAGALSFLQDLANGSNIPALQPLVSIAARIYTSVQAAKSNKKKAKAVAREACNSIKEILDVYPVGSTQRLLEDGVREFQRALEDVATCVERMAQRNRFWRFLNQQEDAQELSDCRMTITEARVQFLVAIETAKYRILQREQGYPVFTWANLELGLTLNETNPMYTRVIAQLVPHQKAVILRRYHKEYAQNFDQDIESLMSLRHPNLPFLGASSLFAPAPFIVLEPSFHNPVQEVIQGLYRHESPRVLQRKAIEIITGVLDAMNHLRENNIVLSDLISQISSIQYDGSKVILHAELPRCEPRESTPPSPSLAPLELGEPCIMGAEPQQLCTVSESHDGGSELHLNMELLGKLLQPFFCSTLFDSVDTCEQENEVLQELFGFPDSENLMATDPAPDRREFKIQCSSTICPLANMAVHHGL
ncbi:hypothetical protein C8F01DRAFT_447570 [Mycena amicta]|nr:hypothetical protein C8F01DRAFT_447570 [Mycena amicta]